jgi:hypothetical protein
MSQGAFNQPLGITGGDFRESGAIEFDSGGCRRRRIRHKSLVCTCIQMMNAVVRLRGTVPPRAKQGRLRLGAHRNCRKLQEDHEQKDNAMCGFHGSFLVRGITR